MNLAGWVALGIGSAVALFAISVATGKTLKTATPQDSPFRALMRALSDDMDYLPLTCIVCEGQIRELEAGMARCQTFGCGAIYSTELLATVDPKVWKAIQQGRFWCAQCEQALPGMPRVYMDERGEPMHCPKHGAPAEVTR